MLSQVEREVLRDLLRHGDNVPSNIADETGRHPTSVSRALSSLEDDDLVANKGRGVWSLTREGLQTARAISTHD